MTAADDIESDTQEVSAKLRGETMAYAAQSGLYNLAANFFEPYLNYRLQKYYSEHIPVGAAHHAHGTYAQNLAGEFAGDFLGATSLILAEALVPNQFHRFSRTIRSWIDPLYTSVAHAVFASQCNQPGYEEKIESWKLFQERNFVRSGVMLAASMVGNIATQKMLGNPSPASLIFEGKLASATLTTAMGLAIRFAFPMQMQGMDEWVGKHVFRPLMDDDKSYAEQLADQSHNRTPAPAR